MAPTARSVSEHVDEAIRAAGRLVALLAVAIGTFVVAGMALKPVFPMGLPRGPAGVLLYEVVIAFSLVVGHVAAAIVFDRGRWEIAGLGADGWRPLRLLTGVAVGAGAVLLPAGVLLVAGVASMGAAQHPLAGDAAVDAALAIVLLAMVEELAVRGYAVGLFEARWGPRTALVASAAGSVAFLVLRGAPAHPAAFLGAAALGVGLGALRLCTGSLAAVLLAHAALDLCRAFVLGDPPPALGPAARNAARWVADGSPWLTGGREGPAAGAVGIATLIAVTFLLFRWRPRTTRRAPT